MYLIFIHDCPESCPSTGTNVQVKRDVIQGSAFEWPDLRCTFTNNKLMPFSVNGLLV